MKTFSVIIEWDEEASVWYVSESDVPGLMTEAATHEEMQRKLSILIPELVELNAHKIGFTPGSELPVFIQAKKLEHFRTGH